MLTRRFTFALAPGAPSVSALFHLGDFIFFGNLAKSRVQLLAEQAVWNCSKGGFVIQNSFSKRASCILCSLKYFTCCPKWSARLCEHHVYVLLYGPPRGPTEQLTDHIELSLFSDQEC
jgi:hypothetical protein